MWHPTLLFFNKIGVGEIVLVILVALFFFGAEKIPIAARNLGKGVRNVNNAQRNTILKTESGSDIAKHKVAIDKVIQEIIEIDSKRRNNNGFNFWKNN